MKRQIIITLAAIISLFILTYGVCTLRLPILIEIGFGLVGGIIIGLAILLLSDDR